ncbi:GTPase [Stomatohabitans albus]|uniref:GTPase n=1 Tax=Stomatohabitans albus TaxID=3110766 RepID=UPI00300C434A
MNVQEALADVEGAIAIIQRYKLGDVQDAVAVVDQAKRRLGLSQAHTVVALAGTTGSGKSTLFNAIVGHEVATPGMKRPTTGEPLAVVFGGLDEAGPLLDALAISNRHYLEYSPEALMGLVLVDLPDFDSFALSNRAQAERLIGAVDAIIWVTDPQKYADASLHQDFLQPMRGHAAVLDVLLNQCDRLSSDEVATVMADLARLLRADGLEQVKPLAVSGLTGDGIPALRNRIGQRVRAREAMVQRVLTDLHQTRAQLPGADSVKNPHVLEQPVVLQAMIPDLAAGIGAVQVADAVKAQTRRDVFLQAGWPPMRWLERWRKIPVTTVIRPTVSPMASAHVAKAMRAVAAPIEAATGPVWRPAVKALVDQAREPVLAGLDQAASRTLSLPETMPWWVRALNASQLIGILAVVLGGIWLIGLRLIGAFLLVSTDTLREAALPIGALPAPTWLVVIGLIIGLVASMLAAGGGALLARQRGELATRQLLSGMHALINTHVTEPLAELSAAAIELHELEHPVPSHSTTIRRT